MPDPKECLEAIEQVLYSIIDEWYENVSRFYVTREQLEENPGSGRSKELKRFHDETGHRIKFNKDDLNFTYGLRAYWEKDSLHIEVSVNNKVENFDYEEFMERLAAHYRRAGRTKVPTPYELKQRSYQEIFELETNFREAFKIERRKGKADIMRLSFRLNNDCLDKLVEHPVSSKELVETYCVSPFRSIYATVYRKSSA